MTIGSHYMELETALGKAKTVEGVCRSCGLVKRYPTSKGRPKKKRQAASKKKTAPRVSVAALPPVQIAESIDWKAAFDAVCHIGSGPASALARITDQLGDTGLFTNVFERRLEMLGHIEIERESNSMTAASWEVVEPLILGLSDGSAVLAGFRSAAMLAALEEYIQDCQGSLNIEEADAPPVVRISNLTSDEFEELAIVMGIAAHRDARYVPRAAEQLCADLAPLSQARQGLPTTTATSARKCERWNPDTARFERANDASSPSAFRLTDFSRRYIYRTAEDIAGMRATVGNARIVKYLAAADRGRSLIGYDSAQKVLYVPLGADLPGLYGRAAALCSGNPPSENREEWILEYRNVPADIAAHLSHLLMS